MGQRLNLEVRIGEEEEDVLFNICFQWGAYTCTALELTKSVWDGMRNHNIDLDDYIKDPTKEKKLVLADALAYRATTKMIYFSPRLNFKSRKMVGLPYTLNEILKDYRVDELSNFDWDFTKNNNFDDFFSELGLVTLSDDKRSEIYDVLGRVFPDVKHGLISIDEKGIEETRNASEGNVTINLLNGECSFDIGWYPDFEFEEDAYFENDTWYLDVDGEKVELPKANVYINEWWSYDDLVEFSESCDLATNNRTYKVACNDGIFGLII